MVVLNTPFTWEAHVTNLISREFLEIVRSRLKEGGVYLYNTTGSLRAQLTGCRTFAHGYLFLNSLVLSDSPLRPDYERWRRNLASYRIDGRPVFDAQKPGHRAALESKVRLSGPLFEDNPKFQKVLSCVEIQARAPGPSIITDDNMGNEWRVFAVGGLEPEEF